MSDYAAYAITEKMKCCCGAEFDAFSNRGDKVWVAAEAERWRTHHQSCRAQVMGMQGKSETHKKLPCISG